MTDSAMDPSADHVAGPADVAPGPETASKPAVRWLTEAKRQAEHQLEHPFTLDGAIVRSVVVRRLSASDVSDFIEQMRADPERDWRYPMFFVGGVADGPRLPDSTWNAMDDDDSFALEKIAEDLIPQRFRRTPAAATS